MVSLGTIQGHIRDGGRCGNAAGWWENAESDFARAEQMGNNALRLSLEWSRIEPIEGHWDNDALDRYRTMLTDLQNRHLKPLRHTPSCYRTTMVCGPRWFRERGQYPLLCSLRHARCTESHDLCDFWLTINELNVYTVQGYILGSCPPGKQNLIVAKRVLYNLLQAHIEAFYAIRRLQPEAHIGYCLDYRLFDPAQAHSPIDCSLSWLYEMQFSWATLHAGETGRFPFPLRIVMPPITRANGTRDYHGVNYYTREMIGVDLNSPSDMFVRRFTSQGAVCSDPGGETGAEEIYPFGLYRVLKSIYQRTRGNKPLYITENGLRDATDHHRPQAILEHLAMVHRAISKGIPVRGYFHWSLVDNFEWLERLGSAFGIDCNGSPDAKAHARV